MGGILFLGNFPLSYSSKVPSSFSDKLIVRTLQRRNPNNLPLRSILVNFVIHFFSRSLQLINYRLRWANDIFMRLHNFHFVVSQQNNNFFSPTHRIIYHQRESTGSYIFISMQSFANNLTTALLHTSTYLFATLFEWRVRNQEQEIFFTVLLGQCVSKFNVAR